MDIKSELLNKLCRMNTLEMASLTPKEVQIVELLTLGANTKDISEKLFVVENTIKYHMTNIHRKIGSTNRTQIALWYVFNLGLLS
jgi:DNA-binding NarL/FixJ family response regulator